MTTRRHVRWGHWGIPALVLMTALAIYGAAPPAAAAKSRGASRPAGFTKGVRGLSSPRGKTIPAGPHAYTQRDFQAARVRWYQRLLVQGYQQFGVHNQAWDAQALNFLRMAVRWCASASDAPSAAQMMGAAQPLIEASCRDPLVQYQIASVLLCDGQTPRAQELLNNALTGFGESKYPRLVAWGAAARMTVMCSSTGDTQAADRWGKLAIQWLATATRESKLAAGEQRQLWFTIASFYDEGFAAQKAALSAALEAQRGADPWIVNVVSGDYHIDAAWQARGNEYAYKVKPEGWRGFEDHLHRARAALVKAWRLHPNYPEPASKMMNIVGGEGGAAGETVRTWFDRAVAAQFDYWPAYRHYLWFSRPRWGGSHEQMYEFGLECLRTKRFDTIVPEYFYTAVWDIAESDGEPQIWREPRVWKALQALISGVLAEPSRADDYASWRAWGAAVGWRCGAYDDAQRLLAAAARTQTSAPQQPTAEEMFRRFIRREFRVSASRARGEIDAATGSDRVRVRQAERFYQAGKAALALPLFRGLLEPAPANSSVAAYLEDRTECARLEAGLAGDDWIPLIDLPGGWRPEDGNWEITKEGVTANASGERTGDFRDLCRARVGGDVEIRGDLDFDPAGPVVGAGVIIDYRNANCAPCSSLVVRSDGSVKLLVGARRDERTFRAEVQAHNSFVVQRWRNRLTLHVNGSLVFADADLYSDAYGPFYLVPAQVGLASYHAATRDHGVRLSNLEIRRLGSKPQGVAKAP